MSTCKVNIYSSAMCERGTKGCDIRHDQGELVQAAGSAQFALDRREQYLSAFFSAARDQRVLGQWRELAETYSKIGREIALAEYDARYLAQNS